MLRQDVQGFELPIAATPGRSLSATINDYVALTKPRIIAMLLVTTLPAMMIADGGMPSLWLVLLTLTGGALAAAGANAINCYLDRDIDGIMARTRERPLPAGSIEPEERSWR
jgi:protoheme IX farnesyltransferase